MKIYDKSTVNVRLSVSMMLCRMSHDLFRVNEELTKREAVNDL